MIGHANFGKVAVMTTQAGATTVMPVGQLLRGWRERRRLSQLQLSTDANVSARHLSFVENGRSRPTPELIERLADTLDVPLRERNDLLLSAGFAPRYPQRSFDAPQLQSVASAFRMILDGHLPHPALVLDRWWDIVDRNSATDLLLQGCAAELLEPPVNAIRLTLHPDGLAPRISNLGQWRAHLIHQVHARAERTADPRLWELLAEVRAYPGGDIEAVTPADVVIPLRITVDGHELSFFSVATAAQTAHDVTIDELQVEAFYPADQATTSALE